MTLEVLYNARCPICGAEIAHYRDYAEERGIAVTFTDLHETDLNQWALTQEAATKRLHVRDGPMLISGVDAFVRLWSVLPRYRLLAKIVSLPGLKWIAERIYNLVLAPALYRMHVHRQSKAVSR